MTVYIDDEGKILDVGSTTNSGLREVVLADEGNPFLGWNPVKICCYRIEVDEDNRVTMMTPYIDTREVKRYDMLGEETNKVDVRVDGVEENVSETTLTVDMILTEMTPEMIGDIEENKATIDMILTEILPELMGE